MISQTVLDYNQIVWIRLAHRLGTDFQYFFIILGKSFAFRLQFFCNINSMISHLQHLGNSFAILCQFLSNSGVIAPSERSWRSGRLLSKLKANYETFLKFEIYSGFWKCSSCDPLLDPPFQQTFEKIFFSRESFNLNFECNSLQVSFMNCSRSSCNT